MRLRWFAAVASLMLGVAFASSAEFGAMIKRVEPGKLTITRSGNRKGPYETLDIGPDVKIIGMKYNAKLNKFEPDGVLDGGLANRAVKEGVILQVVTGADSKVTELRIHYDIRKK